MSYKVRWKRPNESGQVMSQCGRYWFGPALSKRLRRLWYDDAGICLGVFEPGEVKVAAQSHLDKMHKTYSELARSGRKS